MRRNLVWILLVVLAVAAQCADIRYTKRSTNPIRAGAGSYYALVASLPLNTAVEILGKEGNWLKVKLPSGDAGWVAASCLAAAAPKNSAQRSLASVWTSTRASRAGIAAAIKGFAKRYGKSQPATVEHIVDGIRKDFTLSEVQEFRQELSEFPSKNRTHMDMKDLELGVPEYNATFSEQEIGAGIAARIASKGLLNDPKLFRYVNLVCLALTLESGLYDWDFTVLILDDNAVNAYAVPSGYLFITKGAIAQCRDESELAGVIAHEISHISRRHGHQEMRKRLTKIRSDEAFSELEEDTGQAGEEEQDLLDICDDAYERCVHPRLLSYELEADRIGSVLAARAGYDPFGLVRMCERIAKLPTEHPDMFDNSYMAPNDMTERAQAVRVFVDKHFSAATPGARLESRFTAESRH